MNNQSNGIRGQLLKSGLIKSGDAKPIRSHAPRTTNDATLAQKSKNKQAAKRALAILEAAIHRNKD